MNDLLKPFFDCFFLLFVCDNFDGFDERFSRIVGYGWKECKGGKDSHGNNECGDNNMFVCDNSITMLLKKLWFVFLGYLWKE